MSTAVSTAKEVMTTLSPQHCTLRLETMFRMRKNVVKTRLNAFNFVHLDLNFFSLLLWTSLTIWIGKAIKMIASGTTEVAAIGKQKISQLKIL